jgi:hypothetical protein
MKIVPKHPRRNPFESHFRFAAALVAILAVVVFLVMTG